MWASNRVQYKKTIGVHEVDTLTMLSVKLDSLVHKVEARASRVYSRWSAPTNNPFSNTFNPDWRNYPKFYWRDNQNNIRPQGSQFQQPEKKISLEYMFDRALGTLPNNIEVNPKEHVKDITTRSGVQVLEIHVKKLVENKEKVPSTDEEHVEQTEQTVDIQESSGTP
ncbi:Uncharacterized protein Adt_18501 [Abeliophyllum distichum]|uniref:Ribosomal protein S3 n=1 Tax=Abeliophyllum distichum TaxID=126358 RepID=A0ABD1TJK8_9LAMI